MLSVKAPKTALCKYCIKSLTKIQIQSAEMEISLWNFEAKTKALKNIKFNREARDYVGSPSFKNNNKKPQVSLADRTISTDLEITDPEDSANTSREETTRMQVERRTKKRAWENILEQCPI